MRYLNKVSFINSAAVKYAELELNGNVHFIGTQGVGKSTLLRAILFFYNANSLKLGVPSGPTNKNFAEWYFPYRNSYILYEVLRESGAYTILAFKAQNRVCFYFIDAPYDREMLIDGDGKAFESWEKIRAGLDARKVYYSRRIKSYEEYRDILYGNDQGKKEFRRYALLESRQYLNIPRTIQNVFLNSRLDAEFIKQTIIDSMNEDDLRIDLHNYTHHLKDFETQLSDMRQFRRPVVLKQAQETSKLYVAINHLQREIGAAVRRLKGELEAVRELQPDLSEALAADERAKQGLLEVISKEAAAFQRRNEKCSAELTIFGDKLKTAKKKGQYYAGLNIQELLPRVSARNSLELNRDNLLAEKNLLTGQFLELTQKYGALLAEVENQQRNFRNLKEQEKLEVKEEFFSRRDVFVRQYEQLQDEIRRQHKTEVDGARRECEEQNSLFHHLQNRLTVLQNKSFYDVEIGEQKETLNTLEFNLRAAKNQKETNLSQLETLKNGLELEGKSLQGAQQRKVEQVQQRLQGLQKQIEGIQLKLESSQDSFYGWLNQHHAGWENSIGKVCAEDLLFDDSLAPRKTDGSSDDFYGVTLDLSERRKIARSLDDYRHEQTLLQQAVEEGQEEIQILEQGLETDLQKLKQRFQPKVRTLKDSNRELDYAIGQNPQRRETALLQLNQLEERGESEKQSALEQLETERDKVSEKGLLAQQLLDKLEGQLNRRLKTKLRERDQKVAELEQGREQQLATLDSHIEEKRQESRRREKAILAEQHCELENRGADTDRLGVVEENLLQIGLELEFIESKRDLVAEYKKDKLDYFDRLKEFRNRTQLLEGEQEQHRLEFEQQQRGRQQELTELDGQIGQHRSELEEIDQDLDAFEHFQLSEVFQAFEKEFSSSQDISGEGKGCRVIIDGIKEYYYAGLRRQNELKETVDKFLGHFSPDNIFKFETQLSSMRSYLDFSQELTEFIEEDKLSEFERRINERFADIVTGIGKETTDLLSRAGEIQKVIGKINRDFTERNFVGAIGKIELKLDASANSVFVVLRQIKEFNDRHALDFGTKDLFSSQDHDLNNEKAVELLKLLLKEIADSRRSDISLSDSFELKFRVEENQNDTGWVEKLSNVGSDGTDVLVKAMVNIMLLNVFKEGASRRFKDFRLHCMMDEIGKLHPNNVRGILKFANDRNIMLINGSPIENNALNYKHIFKISKDAQRVTRVTRILTNNRPL